MSIQKRIYISSTSADRYLIDESRTDIVSFDLNEPIVCKSNQRMYMSLETFAFPNSLYNITSSNNSITFNATPLTIPVGQYATSSALITAVSSAITTYNGANPGSPINITATYVALTNKVSFQNTSASVIMTVSKDSTLGYVIGLNHLTDLVIAVSSTVVLPRQVDVSNGRTINFSILNLDFDGVDSNGQKTLSSILGTVPISANFGEIQAWTNPVNSKMLLPQKSLSYLEVALINLDNEPFNLGGLRWSAVILITIE